MSFIMHIGPITPKLHGFTFTTFCPDEGEPTTHFKRRREDLEQDRDAIKRGIEMAAGTVVMHDDLDTLDAVIADDDDGCPKNDPECLGNNGDCHDACESPESEE